MGTNILSLGGKKGLFNGNIAWMMTDNWFFDYTTYVPYSGVISHAYKYDQLHRIKAAHSYFSSDGMNVTADNSSNGYHENFNYDRNGNITSLQRRHKEAGLIDNLIYNYDHSNQVNTLSTIQDLSNNPNITNIQNQQYVYKEIGNLITDETNNIIWDSYNKINRVEIGGGEFDGYFYDPLGNKAITKKIRKVSNRFDTTYITYIRDPKGKQLAIYNSFHSDSIIIPVSIEEYTIYGSDQIGTRYMDAPARLYPPLVKSRHRVHYHLKNHLGNILSTITDRRVGYYDVATQEFHHYEPEQYDSRDYYAFGSESRSCENPWVPKHTTKQGFNNKEKSHKTNSQTNYDYGFRIYNAGIGKFLSVDPLTKSYPELTPYQFASNRPIDGVDLDGLEFIYAADGKFIGNGPDKNSLTVQVAEGKLDQDGNTKVLYKKIHSNHIQFATMANIIKQEALSSDPKEPLFIAFTSQNNANLNRISLYDRLLMGGFSSVKKAKKIPLSIKSHSISSNNARAALISVLRGDPDPTDGALFWDGQDYLAWGLQSPNGTPQNKFEEYNSHLIPSSLFQIYLQNVLCKTNGCANYSKAYEKKFDVPASVFTDSQNFNEDGDFDFNTSYDKPLGLKATAVAGQSIFWKTVEKKNE
jgi:RHS repeat-associated protein